MCHEFLREPVLTPGKYVAWQFWLAVLVLLAKKSFKLIRPDRPHADKGTDHHTGLYLPLALCSLTATLPSQKLVIKILDFKERKAGTQYDGQIKTVSLSQFKSKTKTTVSFNVLDCKTGLFCSVNDLDVELTESGESQTPFVFQLLLWS